MILPLLLTGPHSPSGLSSPSFICLLLFLLPLQHTLRLIALPHPPLRSCPAGRSWLDRSRSKARSESCKVPRTNFGIRTFAIGPHSLLPNDSCNIQPDFSFPISATNHAESLFIFLIILPPSLPRRQFFCIGCSSFFYDLHFEHKTVILFFLFFQNKQRTMK